jgi:tripartite ATP-independent transporter DctP family solute receptor
MGGRGMNKKWKSITLVFLVMLALGVCIMQLSFSGSLKGVASADEKVVLKLGYGTQPGHPIDVGARKFKELVEAKSNGTIAVNLFPSSQLGSERAMIESLQLGTIEMTATTTGALPGFDPYFQIFDMPYLFESYERADQVLDGEIGEQLSREMEKLKVVNLAYWENGFRQMTNSKHELVVPEDLKGVKLRTMENPAHITWFNSVGATPTPMAFGEIFSALQQKVVDGQENPISIIEANKFYEVQPYLTVTDHVYSAVAVLISDKVYDRLSQEQQQIVKEAAREARLVEREENRSKDMQRVDMLKKAGIQVTTITDEQKQEWIKSTDDVYEKFSSSIDMEIVQRIRNLE